MYGVGVDANPAGRDRTGEAGTANVGFDGTTASAGDRIGRANSVRQMPRGVKGSGLA